MKQEYKLPVREIYFTLNMLYTPLALADSVPGCAHLCSQVSHTVPSSCKSHGSRYPMVRCSVTHREPVQARISYQKKDSYLLNRAWLSPQTLDPSTRLFDSKDLSQP